MIFKGIAIIDIKTFVIFELLTSYEGLMHRSRRPLEPEAVFGQIKSDNHFKRLSYRGKRLVNAEFATIAVAHNIRKMITKGCCVCSTETYKQKNRLKITF